MIPLLLTGPAGSGKTHRCLAEVAARLREDPSGPPLILLAPRQATYQLERQILSFPGVDGFARLRILSFQRLAQHIFELTGRAEPKLLDEQGRVMVMRAILAKRRDSLRMYRQSAQREGLAQELSDLWRELCENGMTPSRLRASARKLDNRLGAKLADFAEIFSDYAKWLNAHELRDGDELLDLAADAALKGPMPRFGGLWMDGFAQMTPQERRLLNAALRQCDGATLAFCLPRRPLSEEDGFSMWSTLTRTYCRMRGQLGEVSEETLARRKSNGRFDAAPMLAHLEERWGEPRSFDGAMRPGEIRVVKCRDIEAEAIFAAREILKFVRSGGRFRETAALVRSLDGSHDVLQRIFRRYGIPFFMDRRAAVAHHPLAELTRGVLRAIAFGYQHHDLFGALKSGLSRISDHELDWFENMALARGWRGDDWRGKLNCGQKAHPWEIERAEKLRDATLRPIFRLQCDLAIAPNGLELADSLRKYWQTLEVEAQLTKWAEDDNEALHTTVWSQMEEWLQSIELAFANDRMSLQEWLTVVDAGLASLTVGLIPPALDQTLIGAVDRSRNPDLKRVFLLGMNEGIFPKPGKERLLLNDSERDALAEAGLHLAATSIWNIGAEQFYGYIACTRAREALAVTFSEMTPGGEALNPSVFIAHLQRLFPQLETERFSQANPFDVEHPRELSALIYAGAQQFRGWPSLGETWARADSAAIAGLENLPPSQVERLYGARIRTSVSKLEQFAACPFRFFVAAGLRAEERLVFELDHREEGSFQHEILREFHARLEAVGKRWRDISPGEGRELVAQIGKDLRKQFQDGLVEATPANRFRAEAKLATLQDFITGYLELLRKGQFDPTHVELGFGPKGPLPAWVLPIDDQRALEFMGRIDRVDVWIDEPSQQCYALVYDYKSKSRAIDKVLVEHAIQQQLPAYLAAIATMGGTKEFPLPVKAAGAFYVNLAMATRTAKSRQKAFEPDDGDEWKQNGVFDEAFEDKLDPKRTGAWDSTEFADLLKQTTTRLRALGTRIFEGDVRVDPYARKKQRACDHCFYRGVCRIDPWTHSFRKLS